MKRYSFWQIIDKATEMNDFQIFIINTLAFVVAITVLVFGYLWLVKSFINAMGDL